MEAQAAQLARLLLECSSAVGLNSPFPWQNVGIALVCTLRGVDLPDGKAGNSFLRPQVSGKERRKGILWSVTISDFRTACMILIIYQINS